VASEFLVGWGSFDDDSPGSRNIQKTFVIIHDYTSKNLWDVLQSTVDRAARPGLRFHCIHEPLADGGKIYMKGGVPCLRYDQLPAVFCLEHGKDTGLYILNASREQAVQFIESNL
jgi:hypothetical protein